ncbi:hypothetical protein AB9F34_34835, partial [Rhizobium leguminosarum]
TGVGRRQQLDLDCCSLVHGRPAFKKMKAVEAGWAPRQILARNYESLPKSQARFRMNISLMPDKMTKTKYDPVEKKHV